jgi:hypothetical protein
MLQVFNTDREIYRHSQDTGMNCGRACAQMVISSLLNSPSGGSGTAPPANTTPIIDQNTLRTREPFPVDVVSTTSWYTHPDELLKLLKKAPEFAANSTFKNWRVAAHGTLDELLADLVVSAPKGMPAIINVNGWDHWVLVAGLALDNGDLAYLKCLDPFPVNSLTHTYVDECTVEGDGTMWGEPWMPTKGQLGNLDLEMSNVPPPGTLTPYGGKFVGILHGAKPRKTDLAKVAKTLAKQGGSNIAVALEAESLIAQLRDRAYRWNIPELQHLLGAAVTPQVRLVKDINGSSSSYALLTLYSGQLRYGTVAAFAAPAWTLMHFALTKNEKLDASLREFTGETLWFTRDRIATTKSTSSPYFPFRLQSSLNNVWTYRRLFDSLELESQVPPPGVTR